MKVLYVVRYPMNDAFSIKQKIDGQIQGLKKMGCSVSYVCYDKENVYLNKDGKIKRIGRKNRPNSRLYYHLISYMDLYGYCNELIKTNKYDLVYFRSAPINRYAYKMLQESSSKSKVIVEIPTYIKNGGEKQQNIARRIYSMYSSYLWKKCAQYVDLFALMGDEANSYMNRPAINIYNAVSLSGIEKRNNTIPNDKKIHLLAVASMSDWQGYDRLIKGIAKLDDINKNKYKVDMVGGEGDGSLKKWKKLTEELELQDVVIFHGQKSGDELSKFFDIATIGISTLGFYRRGSSIGSPLKVREYMARGLPFIYAHDDPDIDETMDWCLRVQDSSEPIDMSEVELFIHKVKDIPELSQKMRKYAEDNMSWVKQFKILFGAIGLSL